MRCQKCSGFGHDQKAGFTQCSVCGGRGEIKEARRSFFGNFVQVKICDKCFGTGQIPNKICEVCKGSGKINGERSVKFKIHLGVVDGQIIKVKSVGEAGERVGVQSGQFFIAYKDPKTGEVIESSGSIAEIDLKAKKVEKLEMIEETKIALTPLTEGEKARAIEIAKSDEKVKVMLPAGAEVVAVKPLPPLKLKIQTTSEKDGVRVVAYDEREDRRVNVSFESEKGQDIITVNLSTGAVEGGMSLSASKSEEKIFRSDDEGVYEIYDKVNDDVRIEKRKSEALEIEKRKSEAPIEIPPVGKKTYESDSLILEPGDVRDVKTFSPDDGVIEIYDRF